MSVVSTKTKGKLGLKAGKAAVRNPSAVIAGAKAAVPVGKLAVPVGKLSLSVGKPILRRKARKRAERAGEAARAVGEATRALVETVAVFPQAAYELGLVEPPRPKRTVPRVAAGIVIGASAVYFLEPGAGREHRQQVAELIG